MIVRSFTGKSASIELTVEEVLILNNALNEVCNGIHLEEEFDTRMGCGVEEARKILSNINDLAADMQGQGRRRS